jgi:hypothetical protein
MVARCTGFRVFSGKLGFGWLSLKLVVIGATCKKYRSSNIASFTSHGVVLTRLSIGTTPREQLRLRPDLAEATEQQPYPIRALDSVTERINLFTGYARTTNPARRLQGPTGQTMVQFAFPILGLKNGTAVTLGCIELSVLTRRHLV